MMDMESPAMLPRLTWPPGRSWTPLSELLPTEKLPRELRTELEKTIIMRIGDFMINKKIPYFCIDEGTL